MKIFTLIMLLCSVAQAQVKWVTWEEAVAAHNRDQKPIFVDVYTDWCGWCKQMDRTTFADPQVSAYMNERYHSVKFNAERRDTIQFNGKAFVNENTTRKGPHQLAIALLDGKMSYPTYAVIGQPWNKTVVPGYRGPGEFMRILRYFIEGAPKGIKFEDFES